MLLQLFSAWVANYKYSLFSSWPPSENRLLLTFLLPGNSYFLIRPAFTYLDLLQKKKLHTLNKCSLYYIQASGWYFIIFTKRGVTALYIWQYVSIGNDHEVPGPMKNNWLLELCFQFSISLPIQREDAFSDRWTCSFCWAFIQNTACVCVCVI